MSVDRSTSYKKYNKYTIHIQISWRSSWADGSGRICGIQQFLKKITPAITNLPVGPCSNRIPEKQEADISLEANDRRIVRQIIESQLNSTAGDCTRHMDFTFLLRKVQGE